MVVVVNNLRKSAGSNGRGGAPYCLLWPRVQGQVISLSCPNASSCRSSVPPVAFRVCWAGLDKDTQSWVCVHGRRFMPVRAVNRSLRHNRMLIHTLKSQTSVCRFRPGDISLFQCMRSRSAPSKLECPAEMDWTAGSYLCL